MEDVLTLREACEFLKLSRGTLLELAKRKKVPGEKIGRQWRFSRSALIDLLAGRSPRKTTWQSKTLNREVGA